MPVTATITFDESFLFDDAEHVAALLSIIEGIVEVEVHDDDESAKLRGIR